MLEELLRATRKYLAAAAVTLTLGNAGCGGKEEPECHRDSDDCIRWCIDRVLERCRSGPPAEQNMCRELGIENCHERGLYCGRFCGERQVERCYDEDNLVCEQVKEPYCENSCMSNR